MGGSGSPQGTSQIIQQAARQPGHPLNDLCRHFGLPPSRVVEVIQIERSCAESHGVPSMSDGILEELGVDRSQVGGGHGMHGVRHVGGHGPMGHGMMGHGSMGHASMGHASMGHGSMGHGMMGSMGHGGGGRSAWTQGSQGGPRGGPRGSHRPSTQARARRRHEAAMAGMLS